MRAKRAISYGAAAAALLLSLNACGSTKDDYSRLTKALSEYEQNQKAEAEKQAQLEIEAAVKKEFEEKLSQLQTPVHHCDLEKMYADDYTDYSYVYFGTYPQSEVTDKSLIAKIDAALEQKGEEKGDIEVEGVRYRRIDLMDTNDNWNFYENSEEDYRYFRWERIKWRVLWKNENKAFLMADAALDCQEYDEKWSEEDNDAGMTWELCDLRKWLNGYDEYVDVEREDGFTAAYFSDAAFSAEETAAILSTELSNEDNEEYETEGGNATTDKIFVLSMAEATNEEYGFCSEKGSNSSTRWLKATDYCHALGAYIYTNEEEGYTNSWWWLRSPGQSEFVADFVTDDGFICQETDDGVYATYIGVAPALYLDLTKDVWAVN